MKWEIHFSLCLPVSRAVLKTLSDTQTYNNWILLLLYYRLNNPGAQTEEAIGGQVSLHNEEIQKYQGHQIRFMHKETDVKRS